MAEQRRALEKTLGVSLRVHVADKRQRQHARSQGLRQDQLGKRQQHKWQRQITHHDDPLPDDEHPTLRAGRSTTKSASGESNSEPTHPYREETHQPVQHGQRKPTARANTAEQGHDDEKAQ